MNDVYIVGIGATPLGKHLDRTVKSLCLEAVTAALTDASLEIEDIQAAWFSNTRQGILEGQNTIRGQCSLRSMGFAGIPMVNVENACASGSTAAREALAHIKAGFCDIALVVGAEKMFFPDKQDQMLKAFVGGTDVYDLDALRSRLGEFSGEPDDGTGMSDLTTRSIFMDIYAAVARGHMKRYGTTVGQIAAAAAKNHHHSTFNPLSQYRTDMSVSQVLQDRPIVYPLTRSMCAPISDGAAAVILCSDLVARRIGKARSVKLASISLRSSSDRAVDDLDAQIGRLAALDAYKQASIAPEDVDVAEVHDACSFAEILQIENLGLCPRGQGGPFTETGATALGGKVPVNPSGGLVSKGHPVGATGLYQYHELVTQLRGEAGRRQVDDARCAVAENGGGFWGVEEAATTVSVLLRN